MAAGSVVAVLGPVVAFGVQALVQGWQLQHVRSGSMEPFLPVGALAVVEAADPAEVAVGQVVTFVDPAGGDRLVTHRVVEVRRDRDGLRFVTRGDANPGPDPFPVRASDLRGRLRWHAPRLGVALDAARSPLTPALLIAVPGVALVVSEGVAWRRRRRRRQVAGACPACGRPQGALMAA